MDTITVLENLTKELKMLCQLAILLLIVFISDVFVEYHKIKKRKGKYIMVKTFRMRAWFETTPRTINLVSDDLKRLGNKNIDKITREAKAHKKSIMINTQSYFNLINKDKAETFELPPCII